MRQCCDCGGWWFVGCRDLMVVVSCGSIGSWFNWAVRWFFIFSIRWYFSGGGGDG